MALLGRVIMVWSVYGAVATCASAVEVTVLNENWPKPIPWPHSAPLDRLDEDWVFLLAMPGSLAGRGLGLPYYDSTGGQSRFERQGKRVFISSDGGPWRVAGVIVETADDLETLNDSLETATEGLTAWAYATQLDALAHVDHRRRLTSLVVVPYEGGHPASSAFPVTFADLRLIVCFPELRSLDLPKIEHDDLSSLAMLEHLRSLRIGRSDASPDLSPLQSLPELRSLELAGRFRSLSALARMTQLESLVVPSAAELKTVCEITQRCTRLKRFCWPSEHTSQLPEFSGLSGLRSIRLRSTRISDLRRLAALTQLVHLDVAECSALKEVSALANLTDLCSLQLCRCSDLRDLAPMRELHRLRSLSVPPKITDPQLRDITASSPGIRSLTCWECSEISNVSALARLSELTELHVVRCHWVQNLAFLSRLPNLKSLTIDLQHATDCSHLALLSQLVELKLRGPVKPRAVCPLSILGGMPNLTSLELSRWRIQDTTPLESLENLVQLDVCACEVGQDLGSLSNLRKMAFARLDETKVKRPWSVPPKGPLCRLDLCASGIEDYNALGSLDYLETLDLRWEKCSRNLRGLAGLPRLSILALPKCGGDTDFSVLADACRLRCLSVSFVLGERVDWGSLGTLKQLHYLEAHDGHERSSIAPLAHLTGLIGLNLSDCQGIDDIIPLAKLGYLEYLDLRGCEDITDFSPLGYLRRLRRLDLSCTHVQDLTFLQELPRLKWLSLCECPRLSDFAPLRAVVERGVVVEGINGSNDFRD